MSLADELSQIKLLDNIDVIDGKRSYRRGQVAKVKSKIKEVEARSLRDIRLKELQRQHQDLLRNLAIHDALQSRYEELLTKKPSISEAELNQERDRSEEVRATHQDHSDWHEEFMSKFKFYHQGLMLQESLTHVQDSEFLTTPHVNEDLSQLKSEIRYFQTNTMDFADDSQLRCLRQNLQDVVKEVSTRLAAEQKKSSATEKTGAAEPVKVRTEVVSATKLNLELPTFSGNPMDWTDFHALFTASVDKRGVSLVDAEKCCLLLKAMSSEESRRIVKYYSSGSNGYEAALKVLEDAYGQPALIYPHHVQALLAPDRYTYDRQSLRRMRETAETHIRGIERMKGKTFEQFIAAIFISRFDSQMEHEWTTHSSDPDKLPTIGEVLEFFRKREFKLANSSVTEPSSHPKKISSSSTPKASRTVLQVNSTSPVLCPVCSSNHSLSRCPTFLDYDVARKLKTVKENRHCSNCLAHNHTHSQCRSTFTCRKCKGKHHTLLHRNSSSNVDLNESPATVSIASSIASNKSSTSPVTEPKTGLLNTAIVDVTNGPRSKRIRLAIDSGASISLMTESLAADLKLHRYPRQLPIGGLMADGASRCYVQADLHSIFPGTNENISLKFYVVPKIPTVTPPRRTEAILNDSCVKDKKPLADPALGGKVDAIIGSLDINKCQRGPSVYSSDLSISVSPTMFGWTVVAPVDHEESKPICKVQAYDDHLHQSLQQLWELDKTPESPSLSANDEKAIFHFNDTHQIQPDGRYKIKLPRSDHPPTIGQSRHTAVRRFQQNEKSLARKDKLKAFNQVLHEYVQLNHAEPVPSQDMDKSPPHIYYLPIHGVFKDTSTTTKIRAVFDASAKSSTGVSLNDTILARPNLYPLLTDILHQFRRHSIGFSSDISKMFREILLHDDERDLHRFLLRNSSGDICDYRMRRLTFGVKSSPFLATRVIQHLAETHRSSHLRASQAILHDFYVDDFISGASSVEEADELRQELCDLLQTAGMTL